jgi:SET domain-containing protein
VLIVRTYVDRSPLHGCGVFAADPIAAGATVWQPSPVIDLEITREELASLPLAVQETVLAHSFMAPDDRMILARDNGVFFNHSNYPNTHHVGENNVAVRDIAAGEELTEDYRDFPPGACRAFLDKSLGVVNT